MGVPLLAEASSAGSTVKSVYDTSAPTSSSASIFPTVRSVGKAFKLQGTSHNWSRAKAAPKGTMLPLLRPRFCRLPARRHGRMKPSDAEHLVAEVLDCLRHVGFGVDPDDHEAISEQVRVAFACTCATVQRMRLTAQVYAEELTEGPQTGDSLTEHLLSILEWITTADLVDWLVPHVDHTEIPVYAFRNSSILLGAVEVAAIRLPQTPQVASEVVEVCIGPDDWCASSHGPQRVVYSFTECLAILSRGESFPFIEGSFEEVSFAICLEGWSGFSNRPEVRTTRASYRQRLALETLRGDLFRFALRLWCLGVPARILFSVSARPHVSPLQELRGLVSQKLSRWHTLC